MLSSLLPAMLIRPRLQLPLVRHWSQSSFVSKVIVRKVNPFSKIKITSNFHLNVKPYDLMDCPDGNLLRISLMPKTSSGSISTKVTEFLNCFDAAVHISDQNIAIDTIDNLGEQVTADELANAVVCLIEVPVKADLKVFSKRDVIVQNMFSDEVNVLSNDGDIITKNVHTTNLTLTAQHGNIRCEGSTLAHKMEVRSYGEKNIHLNKILGDSLTAISENGTISTNSCYAGSSKFITQKGSLLLKNVHKKSELYLLDGGDVDVTGFHGILNATTNGGTLNFQLTEIFGESCIKAKNPSKFNVNISEFVEQYSCLSITADEITLDPALDYFEKRNQNDGGGEELQTGDRDLNDDLLSIETNGKLKLGKLSWMDAIKLKLSAQKHDEVEKS